VIYRKLAVKSLHDKWTKLHIHSHHNLDQSLHNIIKSFSQVIKQLQTLHKTSHTTKENQRGKYVLWWIYILYLLVNYSVLIINVTWKRLRKPRYHTIFENFSNLIHSTWKCGRPEINNECHTSQHTFTFVQTALVEVWYPCIVGAEVFIWSSSVNLFRFNTEMKYYKIITSLHAFL
jgi:hypothetical protein